MLKRLFPLLTIVLYLFSCTAPQESKKPVLKAKGNKKYGGEFRFMSTEKVDNLFPLYAYNVFAQRINLQIFETLLKVDPDTDEILPGIASSYFKSEDGKKYTFTLRKNIFFHPDPCFGGKLHALNAKDVKTTLEFACSGIENLNKQSSLLKGKIVGSNSFYNESLTNFSKTGVSGIRIINNHTLEINLNEPYAKFDLLLTHPSLSIFPIEAYYKYGENIGFHPVGTGPFLLEKMNDSGISLKRNKNYWRKDDIGNELPFLSKVQMTFSKTKTSEIKSFKNHNTDMVMEIPVEEIEGMLGSLKDAQNGKNLPHKVFGQLSYSVNYIAFSCDQKPFDNPQVRKAIAHAVDRRVIVEEALNGEGYLAENGFVPNMKSYSSESISGIDYNPNLARKMLSTAGYPNGRGFPKIYLWVNTEKGTMKYAWCKNYVTQLKDQLNIDIEIKLCKINEREEAIARGEAICWRAGWVADYPDAEGFLSIFYSKNKFTSDNKNAFHYLSDDFDKNYNFAIVEQDSIKRLQYLTSCDQKIINDAVVFPVYRDDFLVFLNLKVRGFKVNSMEIFDLSEVFIKEIN
ncbi:MAG: ABC transporter substrate-binding protein [Crocinitomicaceae bacterium]|nr:ABC transporter substrate-binding protein [Crocinitomicaceae bacterium]